MADYDSVNGHSLPLNGNIDLGSSADIGRIITAMRIMAAAIDTSGQLDGVTSAGNLTMADATNIVVNTTTGTKIGTATGQKIGFWNATPVTQPTHNADPVAMVSVTCPSLVDSSGGTVTGVTISAISISGTVGQDIPNAIAELAAAIAALKTDVSAAKTAVDANNAAIAALNADAATLGLTAAS